MNRFFITVYFVLLFSNYLHSQSRLDDKEATLNDNFKTHNNSSFIVDRNNFFPNTNIGKMAFNVYGGFGFAPYSGSLSDFFNPDMGGTMSMSYYTYNNMAYFLSLNTTDGVLQKNISEVWQEKDSVRFSSVGIAAGYSLLNRIKWRITPFCGLAFSSSKPVKPKINQYPELMQFRTGFAPTPTIGINMTYKFLKPQKYNDFFGNSGCFALNTQINYLPFAVYNEKLPYRGGVLYLTIGVSMEIFSTHGR